MLSRYKNEPLLTLAEARGQFGYTTDHLAYLCRLGYVWGQRHGRIWLTCSKAVADYQAAMEKFDHPVKLQDLGGIKMLHASWPNFSKPNILTNIQEELVKNKRMYRAIFALKMPRLIKKKTNLDSAGFALGKAPYALPVSPIISVLKPLPWYREALIILPVFLLVFGLSFAIFPRNSESATSSVIEFSQNTLDQVTQPFQKLIYSATQSLANNVSDLNLDLSLKRISMLADFAKSNKGLSTQVDLIVPKLLTSSLKFAIIETDARVNFAQTVPKQKQKPIKCYFSALTGRADLF